MSTVTEFKAIETRYRGALFRSRLEARWACFFDRLKWRWEYEPLDLNGYVPDFILLLHEPVLVEVKPAWTREDLEDLAAGKIEASGWEGEALIVGPSWSTRDRGGEYSRDAVLGACRCRMGTWQIARWGDCGACPDSGQTWDWGGPTKRGEWNWRTFTVAEPRTKGWTRFCRLCGADNVDGTPDLEGLAQLWNEAGSTVQWRAPR